MCCATVSCRPFTVIFTTLILLLSDVSIHLSAHIDRDANYHCRDGNASNEGDAHRRTHQRAKLPEDLLLSAPGLLPPEGAA